MLLFVREQRQQDGRPSALTEPLVCLEVGAFYWTVPAPDIVNSGREEQGSFSV